MPEPPLDPTHLCFGQVDPTLEQLGGGPRNEATARVFVMCDDEHAVLNKYTKRQFFAV